LRPAPFSELIRVSILFAKSGFVEDTPEDFSLD
jgi:hypothetical protein